MSSIKININLKSTYIINGLNDLQTMRGALIDSDSAAATCATDFGGTIAFLIVDSG